MRAGALDRTIEIHAKTISQDSTGQAIETWARVASEWAQVESVLNPEAFTADRTLSYKTKYFTMRYRALSPDTNRIRYEDQDYDILAIGELENRGRRRWLKVLAEVRE